MSILITAANSAQAYQLKSILTTDAEILLGDYLELPELMLKTGKMIKTPNPQSPAFIHEVLALCLDQGIDKVFALRRDELILLTEATQLFNEFDITLYVPAKDIIAKGVPGKITDDKVIIINKGQPALDLTATVALLPIGEQWIDVIGDGLTGVFKNDKIFTAD